MANPPISRIDFTSTTVVVVADTQKFTFPLKALQATPVVTAPTAPPTSSSSLRVGPSRELKEIADAIPFAQPGGEIVADDAVYLKPFHSDVWDLKIRSASGNPYRCLMDMRGGNGGGVRMAWEKSAMHLGAQTTIVGIGVIRAGSLTSGRNYSNEAAFYAENFARPGFLRLERCAVDNSGNGVFIPADRGASGNISYIERECIFGAKASNSVSNPQNSGPSHDRYIGCPIIDIDGSLDFGCVNGHSIKSGADMTLVKNSYMASHGGRAVELPYGGTGQFTNCTIVSRDDGNANFIGFADEEHRLPGLPTLTFDGGQILVGRSPSTIFVGAGANVLINPNVMVGSFGGFLAVEGGGTVKGLPSSVATVAKPQRPALPAWAVA
ncbi:MAG: hypothetical protein JWP57_4396 [Spirosoma sp.]|nr:hypothetical protein [Spirosoma sp.]